MEKIIRRALAVVMTVTCGFFAYAEDEAEDVREFQPIHATISPGDGTLRFEENYSNKAMISTDGEFLNFKSGKGTIMTNTIELPINGQQDYTMEFTFNLPTFGGFITMMFNRYGVLLTKKGAQAFTAENAANAGVYGGGGLVNNVLAKAKLTKIPAGKEKNQFVCKIVKRKKIVTIFVNDQFITEFTDKVPGSKLEMDLTFAFGTEGRLQSVRLDQGAETMSED